MPKAKSLDRLELTRQKMQARERLKANAQVVIPPEYTKENSPFLKMREEMLKEHPELLDEAHTCPVCNGELVRYEGCYRCKKCGWSKC
ncbi:MAG: hypothetical protein IJ859_04745 [Synergistaceae bacterium]|nr:hypothetical protein [Synergistaceae bacterium]